MKPILRGLLTFLGLQGGMVAVAYACSCGEDDYDPIEIKEMSELVFVGTVVSGPHAGLFSGCGSVSSMDPVRYKFEVTEAFKGVEAGEVVEIVTARDGASCGVEFGEGERWLIYTLDGEYGLCDPGGLVDGREEELEQLRAGE